jgi:SAM-dependent methyltransferase
MKRYLNKAKVFFGTKNEKACNICGWTGPVFGPMKSPTYTRENAVCPQCGSLERHRALIQYIEDHIELDGVLILDIAPIRAFERWFAHRGTRYVSVDLMAPAIVRCDLLRLPFCDALFHCIICYHVLEHIKNDFSAMCELHRVLNPTGIALIQVPFDERRAKTTEYDVPDTFCHDHIRSNYGKDLFDRLRASGFRFEIQDLGELYPKKLQKKYGFNRASGTTFICRKT